MEYIFGTVGADCQEFLRCLRLDRSRQTSCVCSHDEFTLYDGKYICNSCGAFEVIPALFNYVPDESQLTQQPAFKLCSHEPIVVNKPSTNTPLCTTCGAYLELANVYKPKDFPLTDTQQSALIPHCADLLHMENSFHQKWHPDVRKKARKAAGVHSAGTDGSLAELEKGILKLLLKGAQGGCVVVVHDTHKDNYFLRVISNCGVPNLKSVSNAKEVLEYYVFSPTDLHATPIEVKVLNRGIKRCFEKKKQSLPYLASYLVNQAYTRYHIVAVSIKMGNKNGLAVRPGYQGFFIDQSDNEAAWRTATARRIVAAALVPSSAQEAYDLLGCLSGSLPSNREDNSHISRFWLLHGKHSQSSSDRSPRHTFILSLLSSNSKTYTSRTTEQSVVIVDQPVDSGMNGGDVQVNSQSNQPPTVAALSTNGTLSANGIEQDENSAIATIQTEALVSEIHAATSALIVGEQAIPLAVELADEAQESNTDNIAVSSSNTATDVGVGEPQSLSTDELRTQPIQRLVRDPDIIPMEMQMDKTTLCTVVLRHIEPMSTHFVVTIVEQKKVVIVKVDSAAAATMSESINDVARTLVGYIQQQLNSVTFTCNCGPHSSSGYSASCYATEFLKITLNPESRLPISYRHTEAIVQHLPTCWSVQDLNTSQVAIVKVSPRRNANSGTPMSCSICHTEGICTHKQAVLDNYFIEYRETTASSEPVVSQSPIKFDSTNGEFEANRDDLVSRGTTRSLFLANENGGNQALLYGSPQEFKQWQAANVDNKVPHVFGNNQPCHGPENTSHSPLKQQFIIFDIGGAAMIELELCTVCGKSRTLVDETYDLFLYKGRSMKDKVTIKNKFGIGITMALARHFAQFETRRQCMNDLFNRLDTILAGDSCLRSILGESFEYCFNYKKLQHVVYAALASCNIMNEVLKGSCLHRHNNEITSIIFDVVWIGQNAGYMPDSAFSVTRPTGDFANREKQQGTRYSRSLITGDESDAGQLRLALMELRLITSTEAENIAVLKNAFEDLRLKTDALNEKLNYDADAGLNLFSEVLDCALALLSAIQDVDATNTSSGVAEINAMIRLLREVGTYSTVTCIMNDITRAVIEGFVQGYSENNGLAFPLQKMPNEVFEHCNALWKTQRDSCQKLVVSFFKFVFVRMDAVRTQISSTAPDIRPWDESQIESSKLSKQNPIETGLISLVPPVNDVYSYKGDRPGQTTKDNHGETCNKYYQQSASSGGRLGLMLGFCGDCGNLLIVELLKTEGRRDVFDLLQRFVVLRTEDQKNHPVKIYYDFMCGLAEFTANRDPHMFQFVELFHDKFHAKSHSKTCSGWLLHKNDHRNTEIAEQANSIFAGISNMLGRCGWIMGMFNIAVAVACFNKIRNIRYEQELKAKELEMQRLPTL